MVDQTIRLNYINPSVEAEHSSALELLCSMYRRKAIIIALTAILSISAIILVLMLPLTYRSAAFVAIDGRRIEMVKVDDVLASIPRDTESIGSEIEVLRSRELVGKAAERLGLFENTEFNEAIGKSGVPSDGRDITPQQFTATTDRILSRLAVEPQGRSRVVRIEFAARTPEIAAAFPNALVDVYLEAQIQARMEANNKADAWVTERLNQLRATAEISGRQAAAFRYTSGQARGKEVTLLQQTISELTTQMVAAGTRRSEAAAKLQQAKRAQESGQTFPAGDPAASILQQLRLQEAESARRVADLESRVGADHPAVRQANERLAATRVAINSEAERLVQGLSAEYDAAREAEESLTSELERMKERIARTGASEARLAELEAVAAADRSVYQTFLARSKEIKVQDAPQASDARVISRASVPPKPSFPNKLLLSGAGVVTSLVIALAAALALEAADSGIRTMSDVERILGLPAVGILPSARLTARRQLWPSRNRLLVIFKHAIGDLLTQIISPRASQSAPRVVAITSSLPQEGKTTTSIALARAGAEAGLRVLLIDADLRRSSIALALGLASSRGLADCISGDADAKDIILSVESAGFSVLPAGKVRGNPAVLLASQRTKCVLADLRMIYDLIIVDTTPVVVGADAGVIASVADELIFLVRWGNTPRQAAVRAVQQLVSVTTNPIGVVLARVNLRKNSTYRHGDGVLYSRRLRAYYTSA